MVAGFRAIKNSDDTPVDPLEISIEIANIVIAGADTTVCRGPRLPWAKFLRAKDHGTTRRVAEQKTD